MENEDNQMMMSSDSSLGETSDESDSELDAMVAMAEKVISGKRKSDGQKTIVAEPESTESNSDSETHNKSENRGEQDGGTGILSLRKPIENIYMIDKKDASSASRGSSRKAQKKKTKPSTVQNNSRIKLSSSLQPAAKTADMYINFSTYRNPKSKETEVLKKSVVSADFEKKDSIKAYEEGKRQLQKQRQKERALTKGKNWFDLPATELTEERKNDLNVLQMRRVLDPKRFYKNNDMKALPKYFQFGRVVESAADFYHSRVPKKQRKATMVDELLADAEFRKFNKRKYAEIQEKQTKSRGRFKHAKRLKNKKR